MCTIGTFQSRLEALGGDARHPVVAVDQVVMDALFGGKLLDALDELGQVSRQLLLGQGHLGPGGDVHHAVAVAQVVQHVRDVLVLRAGEDIHVHAAAAQVARDLADVDVHPAGVLAAQDGQRAGVVGDHGDVHR